MGQYPGVSLSRAREKRDEARRVVADRVDPTVQRLVDRNAKAETFGAIAAEWLALKRKRLAPATRVARRRATRDPTQHLRGALAPVVTTHHAAITEPLEDRRAAAGVAFVRSPAGH